MQIIRGISSAAARPIAMTIGNFDGVHLGHRALLAHLREAAAERKLATSVLTFEPHPREFCSPRSAPPRLTGLREKARLISESNVDLLYVQRFDAAFSRLSAHDFVHALERMDARFLMVGDDFRFGRERMGDFAFLQKTAKRFELRRMHSVTVDGERVSSSAVRAALTEGHFARAESLLGRDYSLSGKIVHGNKLGAKLGFPTANIQLKNKRPPIAGIFVAEIAVADGERRQGVASLGFRPTVSDSNVLLLEFHIFDFEDILYGEYATVFFLHKLRDEAKYGDLKMLSEQIAKDVKNAKAWFGIEDRE